MSDHRPYATPLQVIFEDNHLLVLNKPAGLPTMGTTAGSPSLLLQAKAYIKHKYAKPGEVYLGIVSRLDSAVSGVVVLARTSKAAARLNRQFAQRETTKLYWALVEGQPNPPVGTWQDWLQKNESAQRMQVVPKPANSKGQAAFADHLQPGEDDASEGISAQLAITHYRSLGPTPRAVWLELTLETGRKHQLRVQLAHHGFPILGDSKYGSRKPFAAGIALHSQKLVLEHPVSKARLAFTAPVPSAWRQFGVEAPC